MPRNKHHRKHTPIVSRQQQKLFGAELSRRESGEPPDIPSITKKELEGHLGESKGKILPIRITLKPKLYNPPMPLPPSTPRVQLVKRHEDGDMTVRMGGKLHVVTTDKKVFQELPKSQARATGLASKKVGQIFITPVKGGKLLSRRNLARTRRRQY